MGGITPGHLIIVLIVVMIVVGPGKLPELGSALGKSIREFQKATGPMKDLVDPAKMLGLSGSQPTAASQAQPAVVAPVAAPMMPVAQPMYGQPYAQPMTPEQMAMPQQVPPMYAPQQAYYVPPQAYPQMIPSMPAPAVTETVPAVAPVPGGDGKPASAE